MSQARATNTPTGMQKIIINDARPKPRVLLLEPGCYVAGRDPANSLHLDDPSASNRHFELDVHDNGQIEVRDLGSANGTWVNGVQIVELAVWPGDTIRAGSASVILQRTEAVTGNRPGLERGEEGQAAGALAFARLIPGAFGYPLQGNTLAVIALFVILEAGLDFLPGLAQMLFWPARIVLGGYLFAVWQGTVALTAAGEDDIPPGFFIDLNLQEILACYWKYLVVIFICAAPFVARIWIHGIPNGVFWALAAAGGACLPMCLLSVAMTDSLASLNPVFVIRSIARAAGPYLLLLALFGLIFGVQALVSCEWLPESAPWAARTALGSLGSLAGLYLFFVAARALGLFYRSQRERLQWGA